jgi:uncharacterized ubiquitin-like protein YukD
MGREVAMKKLIRTNKITDYNDENKTFTLEVPADITIGTLISINVTNREVSYFENVPSVWNKIMKRLRSLIVAVLKSLKAFYQGFLDGLIWK